MGGMLRIYPLLAAISLATLAGAASPDAPRGRGYEILLEKAFVPGSLDAELFASLWRVWEEPLRSRAEQASPEERRRMTLARYGLTETPDRAREIPLQYAPDSEGRWAANCFLCHAGKVAGRVIPGLPNTHIALETLSADTAAAKRLLGRKFRGGEIFTSAIPLGRSNGTTNAVIFGVLLGAYRDADLVYHPERPLPERIVHNDHDAPAWWHMRRKQYLYADGFAGKGPRALMQFMMVPQNGPQAFHEAEDDFRAIYDWIESLAPPHYEGPIDEALADEGQRHFQRVCAECHGTYGVEPEYPERIVPWDEVRTDRARLDSLTVGMRAGYERSWFSHYGQKPAIADPGGYVAPPLDGLWATAPYFHNGSVPTLWHVLHPQQRPAVWQRTEDGYDHQRLGLEVVELDEVPRSARRASDKRTYFDTRLPTKSAAGHDFPDVLGETEKRAVLEYLKRL